MSGGGKCSWDSLPGGGSLNYLPAPVEDGPTPRSTQLSAPHGHSNPLRLPERATGVLNWKPGRFPQTSTQIEVLMHNLENDALCIFLGIVAYLGLVGWLIYRECGRVEWLEVETEGGE